MLWYRPPNMYWYSCSFESIPNITEADQRRRSFNRRPSIRFSLNAERVERLLFLSWPMWLTQNIMDCFIRDGFFPSPAEECHVLWETLQVTARVAPKTGHIFSNFTQFWRFALNSNSEMNEESSVWNLYSLLQKIKFVLSWESVGATAAGAGNE